MFIFQKAPFLGQLNRRLFSDLRKILEKHEIIPDIINTTPEEVATISYSCCVSVDLGNILTPSQVKNIPTIKWNNCQTDCFYTICMTDPDAPSRQDPSMREWQHWLVGNIPGGSINKGSVLSAYIGAAPPQSTDLHRYVFLIYKQLCEIDFNEKILFNNSVDGRACFSISNFAKKYKLFEPIACNFFQAEWDDYVPTIYKQLEQ